MATKKTGKKTAAKKTKKAAVKKTAAKKAAPKKTAEKKSPPKKAAAKKTKRSAKKAAPKKSARGMLPETTGAVPPGIPCICRKFGSRWFCMKMVNGTLVQNDGPFATKAECEERFCL